MNSFARASGVAGIDNPILSGLLTSILELGAWFGVLINGVLADALGRKLSVLVASVAFCVGVVIQAATHGGSYDYILAGRFVTGIGVGTSFTLSNFDVIIRPPLTPLRFAFHDRPSLQCRACSP